MMISGTTSETSKLNGIIMPIKPLNGFISNAGGLIGKLSVSVRDVPYYETSNPSGGTTVYIGKEIANNGNK